MLEPTSEANAARRSRVDIFEADDGTVSVRAHGIELPATAFQKRGLATVPHKRGAIVPNKHLSAVLALIREQQLLETQDELAAARTYRARRLVNGQLSHALSS